MEEAITVAGGEDQALMERARMLVGVSLRLGIPLSKPADPQLQACIDRVMQEAQSSSTS